MPRLLKLALATTAMFLLCPSGISQTRIKSMFYNLLTYSNNASNQNKTFHLKTILDSEHPDLIMVCELQNETASNYLFSNAIEPHNAAFAKAPFQSGKSPDTSLLQMVYYNTKKLVYESSRVITTNIRDINHYTFKINTTDVATNPIRLEVFVTHLKASSGSENIAKRLASVEDFVSALDDISDTSFVLFSGDFNFYSSNESGYQKLLDMNNSIQMIDPIDRPSSSFWDDPSYSDIHTQSTRTSNTGLIDTGGATGGLDDRFDFIMMSKNFNISSDLYYINNSYRAVGNNENCYNSYINNPSCIGSYSQSLRNALIEFSDHLPVVMEIETTRNTLTTKSYSTATIKGANWVSNLIQVDLLEPATVKSIYIYSQLGQKVKTHIVNKNTKEQSIDISRLSKGIYYLTTQKMARPLKFVKY